MKIFLTCLILVPLFCVLTKAQTWKELGDSSLYYKEKQNYETALSWANKALSVVDVQLGQNDSIYAKILGNIANIYYHYGKLDSALFYQEIHLKLCRKIFKGDHPDLAQSINEMAFFMHGTEMNSEEESLNKEALEMRRRIYKGDHPEIAESLNNLAAFYFSKNDFNQAEPLFVEVLAMRKRLSLSDNPEVASSMANLASLYKAQNRLNDAEPLFKEALEMFIRLYKEDHPEVANNLCNLAEIYYSQGRLTEAEPLYKKVIEIRKKLYKTDSPDVAVILNNLSAIYCEQSRYREAEPLLKEALDMNRRLFKGDNPDIAWSLSNLAGLYEFQGRMNEAEPLYKEALEMRQRLYPGGNPELAQSMNFLAGLYKHQGRLREAEPLYKELVALNKHLNNNDNTDLAMSLNNLAFLYMDQSRLSEAEPLFKEALEINMRLFKGDHPDKASCLNNLAELYDFQGRINEAEIIHKEVLEMRRRLFKDDHMYIAQSLNNLAKIYKEQGRFTDAEPMFKEALEMRKRLYKADHPDIAWSLNYLAGFYEATGRLDEAEPMFKEALVMYQRLYKGDHPNVAATLNNIAIYYYIQGRISEAESMMKESLEMYKNIFKNDHHLVANSTHCLAAIFYTQGKFNEAEPLYKEALEMLRRLFKGDHPKLSSNLLLLGKLYKDQGRFTEAEATYKEALEMRRRLFKDDHPYVATGIENIAGLYLSQGRFDKVDSLYIELMKISSNLLNDYFPSLSEKEKGQYFDTFSEYYLRFNNFTAKHYSEFPQLLETMFDNQLLTKAILLNASNKVRRRIMSGKDTSLIQLFGNWKNNKEKISKFYQLSNSQLEKKSINLDSIIRSANEQEKLLARNSEAFKKEFEKKKLNWKDIQTSLNITEAAIEIVRFPQRGKIGVVKVPKDSTGRDSIDLDEMGLTDTVYYAALLIKNGVKNPELVFLKNGTDLEGKFIELYRKQIEKQRKGIHDSDAINAVLRELYNQFWAPIQEKLEKIKTVYLSVDGVYNQINLNTLINPATNKYLLDEIDLKLVTTTKDLVERNPINPPLKKGEISNTAELFGDPQFDLDSTKYLQLASNFRSGVTRDYYYLGNTLNSTTRGAIAPLPGTRKEIENIANSFKERNWTVNKHLGAEAIEEALKAVNNPRVLHIATHGKFLKDVERRDDERMMGFETQRFVENPLLKSMLLFSGAENTIVGQTSSSAQSVSAQTEDGLLTAYESQNLNLDNTELVVLSACETGLGEIKNGEGVYGLQRAFQVAGAKSLIMSLWSVSDQATQELMTSFYNKWLSGKTKREAFREAQQDLKQKYPGFYYWGAFVMLGE